MSEMKSQLMSQEQLADPVAAVPVVILVALKQNKSKTRSKRGMAFRCKPGKQQGPGCWGIEINESTEGAN